MKDQYLLQCPHMVEEKDKAASGVYFIRALISFMFLSHPKAPFPVTVSIRLNIGIWADHIQTVACNGTFFFCA